MVSLTHDATDAETATTPALAELSLDTTTPEPADTSDLAQLYRTKKEWINQMRLKFCRRPEFEITQNIIHDDGTLNQDYFRPPKDALRPSQEQARKWTDQERDLLVQGVEQYGIGHFREISEALLPAWSPNDLRVKSIRLMGRQNLQLYRNWRGNAEAIKREYERNKAIGLRLNAWKGGCLVYDDDGLVLKAIMETEPTADAATLADADQEEEVEIE
ncbi:hypothetical protein H4R34_001910 [Dimargaris verticillata]|uniref:Myb-like domain-containing protein n=1 Tax=Dimargaris verticillata TaxID=2761393 RepID=A0A9W8E9U5_9FUNG|nr:hypothetical protein H4R34_001910 [Dimargaris verticillata]